jgi:uncharacterized protein with beta-barrel porin domain
MRLLLPIAPVCAAVLFAAGEILFAPQALAQCAATGTNQTCTNPAGTTVSGGAVGIFDSNTLTVTNSGTISGSSFGALANTANVTNFNTISGGATGILANITNFSNFGIISGVSTAGIEAITVTGTNSGTISGVTGIIVDGSSGSAVTNSGTITGTGGTAIDFHASSGNTLTLGPGFVTNGNVLGSGSDTLQLGGTGSGTFNLSSIGAGQQYRGFTTFNEVGNATWTVTGTSSQSNPWTVQSGALVVNGSLASSSLTTVNSGGTLGGTGTVGNTSIAGGTFEPGSGMPGSFLTVSGTLGFTPGSTYVVNVNPTSSSFANVSGAATLNGASVNAIYANGSYLSKQYLILNAGSVSGTFGSLANTNMPSDITDALSYDATHAYLNLTLHFTTPPAGSLNTNQQNVANTLTNFFNTTGGIPIAFATLSPNGLTQASGEAATGTQQTTFDAMRLFVGTLMNGGGDSFSGGTIGPGGPTAFADEINAQAYAAITPRNAPLAPFEQRWSVFAQSYGGSSVTSGNSSLGTNTTNSQVYGVLAGADYHFSPDTLIGFGLGGGGTSFGIANGLGGGRSDLFQAGVYATHKFGAAYLSAAVAYGWQDVTTNRTVTITSIDSLQANFRTNTLMARAEGGYRFVTPLLGVTPYGAMQVTSLGLPSFAESAVAGGGTFALNYAGETVTATRSELGVRVDKPILLTESLLTLRGQLAWAHDYNQNTTATATFQSLPGASFLVNGATPLPDLALVAAGGEIRWLNGLTVLASFVGEFSSNTQSYGGRGGVRYTW